ncbi:MAG: Dabb family protein [Chloroflexota bacterium]|nr:Dabb family protein [Chloroflexota bacterium]
MIRHVILFTLKPDVSDAQLKDWEAAIRAARFPGLREYTFGRDLGLRPGNMSAAATFDFEDEAAYRAFDVDPEHERIRREVSGPLVERIERVQYRV